MKYKKLIIGITSIILLIIGLLIVKNIYREDYKQNCYKSQNEKQIYICLKDMEGFHERVKFLYEKRNLDIKDPELVVEYSYISDNSYPENFINAGTTQKEFKFIANEKLKQCINRLEKRCLLFQILDSENNKETLKESILLMKEYLKNKNDKEIKDKLIEFERINGFEVLQK